MEGKGGDRVETRNKGGKRRFKGGKGKMMHSDYKKQIKGVCDDAGG